MVRESPLQEARQVDIGSPASLYEISSLTRRSVIVVNDHVRVGDDLSGDLHHVRGECAHSVDVDAVRERCVIE